MNTNDPMTLGQMMYMYDHHVVRPYATEFVRDWAAFVLTAGMSSYFFGGANQTLRGAVASTWRATPQSAQQIAMQAERLALMQGGSSQTSAYVRQLLHHGWQEIRQNLRFTGYQMAMENGVQMLAEPITGNWTPGQMQRMGEWGQFLFSFGNSTVLAMRQGWRAGRAQAQQQRLLEHAQFGPGGTMDFRLARGATEANFVRFMQEQGFHVQAAPGREGTWFIRPIGSSPDLPPITAHNLARGDGDPPPAMPEASNLSLRRATPPPADVQVGGTRVALAPEGQQVIQRVRTFSEQMLAGDHQAALNTALDPAGLPAGAQVQTRDVTINLASLPQGSGRADAMQAHLRSIAQTGSAPRTAETNPVATVPRTVIDINGVHFDLVRGTVINPDGHAAGAVQTAREQFNQFRATQDGQRMIFETLITTMEETTHLRHSALGNRAISHSYADFVNASQLGSQEHAGSFTQEGAAGRTRLSLEQEMLFIWRDAGWTPQMLQHFFGHNHVDVRSPAFQHLNGQPVTAVAGHPAPATGTPGSRPSVAEVIGAPPPTLAPSGNIPPDQLQNLRTARERLRMGVDAIADSLPPAVRDYLRQLVPSTRIPDGADAPTSAQMRAIAQDLTLAHQLVQIRPEILEHIVQPALAGSAPNRTDVQNAVNLARFYNQVLSDGNITPQALRQLPVTQLQELQGLMNGIPPHLRRHFLDPVLNQTFNRTAFDQARTQALQLSAMNHGQQVEHIATQLAANDSPHARARLQNLMVETAHTIARSANRDALANGAASDASVQALNAARTALNIPADVWHNLVNYVRNNTNSNVTGATMRDIVSLPPSIRQAIVDPVLRSGMTNQMQIASELGIARAYTQAHLTLEQLQAALALSPEARRQFIDPIIRQWANLPAPEAGMRPLRQQLFNDALAAAARPPVAADVPSTSVAPLASQPMSPRRLAEVQGQRQALDRHLAMIEGDPALQAGLPDSVRNYLRQLVPAADLATTATPTQQHEFARNLATAHEILSLSPEMRQHFIQPHMGTNPPPHAEIRNAASLASHYNRLVQDGGVSAAAIRVIPVADLAAIRPLMETVPSHLRRAFIDPILQSGFSRDAFNQARTQALEVTAMSPRDQLAHIQRQIDSASPEARPRWERLLAETTAEQNRLQINQQIENLLHASPETIADPAIRRLVEQIRFMREQMDRSRWHNLDRHASEFYSAMRAELGPDANAIGGQTRTAINQAATALANGGDLAPLITSLQSRHADLTRLLTPGSNAANRLETMRRQVQQTEHTIRQQLGLAADQPITSERIQQIPNPELRRGMFDLFNRISGLRQILDMPNLTQQLNETIQALQAASANPTADHTQLQANLRALASRFQTLDNILTRTTVAPPTASLGHNQPSVDATSPLNVADLRGQLFRRLLQSSVPDANTWRCGRASNGDVTWTPPARLNNPPTTINIPQDGSFGPGITRPITIETMGGDGTLHRVTIPVGAQPAFIGHHPDNPRGIQFRVTQPDGTIIHHRIMSPVDYTGNFGVNYSNGYLRSSRLVQAPLAPGQPPQILRWPGGHGQLVPVEVHLNHNLQPQLGINGGHFDGNPWVVVSRGSAYQVVHVNEVLWVNQQIAANGGNLPAGGSRNLFQQAANQCPEALRAQRQTLNNLGTQQNRNLPFYQGPTHYHLMP